MMDPYRRGPALSVLMAAAAAAALAAPAESQAVCSAPHSAPVVSTGGPIQTLPAGAGWLQVAAFHQGSSSQFGADGATRAFLVDGRVTTKSLYATGAVGLGRGIDLWLQLPVHDLSYEDAGGSRGRMGVGDPRVALRVGGDLVGLEVPFALRAAVKLPGSEFPRDPVVVVPLGEGQRDWELSLEYGQTLAGPELYAVAWAGYRWREADEALERDYGNELFGHLALGGIRSRMSWELAVEAMSGENPVFQRAELPGMRRALLQVNPALGYRLGTGRVTLGAQIPVAGRNLPTGPAFNLGYLVSWNAR